MKNVVKIVSILLLTLTFAGNVQADLLPGDDAGVVCAAIFPCDLTTGQLLPEYSDENSPCFEQFSNMCDFELSLRNVGEKLAECESQKIGSVEENQKFKKKVKRLRRKLKSLKRK